MNGRYALSRLILLVKHTDSAWQITDNNMEPTVTLRNIPRKLTEVFPFSTVFHFVRITADSPKTEIESIKTKP